MQSTGSSRFLSKLVERLVFILIDTLIKKWRGSKRRRVPRYETEFFIAAFPPVDIARDVHHAFDRHRKNMGRDRDWEWKKAEHFHVTLAIAGDLMATDIEKLIEAVSSLNIGPFDTEISYCDYFLKPAHYERNNHVLWAGFDKIGAKKLTSLYRAIQKNFRTMKMNQYQNKFTPHITVARPRNHLRKKLTAGVKAHKNLEPPIDWPIDHISIMQRLPRSWIEGTGLPTRFHEIARLDLRTKKMVRMADVISSHAEATARL